MIKKTKQKLKTAIFHAFLKGDAKGGAELLMFQVRDFLKSDFWVGSMDFEGWNKNKINQDPFIKKFWQTNQAFYYLHAESKLPLIRHLKRQFFFLFSPKIKELANYQVVIFQGNNFFIPRRLKKIAPNVKQVLYVNTPPRIFTDQFESKLKKIPKIAHPIAKFLKNIVLNQYQKDAKVFDSIIANSQNIKQRLQKYLNIQADEVIFPVLDTSNYKFIKTGDYFLSYARLEETKRIPMILEAFSQMPEQKLVICSSGPLSNWVKNKIKTENLTNIEFKGRVSDEELIDLVGNCLAGVFIPKDEDAGMTQIELMTAGKPVIGVAEGGLLETIIDKETGILLSKNIQIEDLKEAVRKMTLEKAQQMRNDCEIQGKKFSKENFLRQIKTVIERVYN